MTRILLVTPYYQPDGGPAAPLFTMLCEGLVLKGHQVSVITGVPHYPSGEIPPEYRGLRFRKSVENGVDVTRVPLFSVNRASYPKRFVQSLVFQIHSVIAGTLRKYDVFITHSPGMELFLPFLYFSKIRKKPTIYSVHDVYPSVGIKLGIFKNRIIIEIVERLEKFCLHNSDAIRVLSNSFIDELSMLGVDHEAIELIYDWIDLDKWPPQSKDNPFSRDYSLNESFNVVYAGNVGQVQALDSIIQAAYILNDRTDIQFVIVGEGTAKAELGRMVEGMGLQNVIFIPYQPFEKMSQVLASADVCLVTLRKGTGYGALPSKIYSIMASARPILISIDEGSDAWDLVKRSGSGICISPESPESLAGEIQKLFGSPELRVGLGEKGRDYVRAFHSPEFAAESFSQIINRIVPAR